MASQVSPYVENVRSHFESNKRKKDYVSHQAKVSTTRVTGVKVGRNGGLLPNNAHLLSCRFTR